MHFLGDFKSRQEEAMSPDPQTLYLMLGQLIETTPDFSENVPLTREHQKWLGQASALVGEAGEHIDKIQINIFAQNMNGTLRLSNAHAISTILHRTLAAVELRAPSSGQGAFIPAGNSFDAFAAIGKVLGSANDDLLVVDPYMDANALTDFAVTASEHVHIRLLADRANHKAGLNAAMVHWISQYADQRPLQVKLAAPKVLHDRLIIVDRTLVYILTQSLNAFASRSPASVSRVDPENTKLKITAYETIWADATPLTANL
jgi:hypothetical protein